jgi:hypothetical protein
MAVNSRQRLFVQVTQAILRDYFEYREGGLYQKQERRGTTLGKRFGAISPGGRLGSFFSAPYLEHQLVWVYHHGGNIPKKVYHHNKNVYDNHIENLYTKAFDSYHAVPKRGGKSPLGIKNVAIINHKKDGTPNYRVTVRENNKEKHLYYGPDFFEACCIIESYRNKVLIANSYNETP